MGVLAFLLPESVRAAAVEGVQNGRGTHELLKRLLAFVWMAVTALRRRPKKGRGAGGITVVPAAFRNL